jgi:hypothetical protein
MPGWDYEHNPPRYEVKSMDQAAEQSVRAAAHPRRSVITDLWSSTAQIVSLIGLLALPAEEPGGEGDAASAPTRRAVVTLQSKALPAWIGWCRHRVAQRKVMQELTAMREEMLMRQHLIRWFEYCEHLSMSLSPQSASMAASMEYTTQKSREWNPSLGVLAVATPPRLLRRRAPASAWPQTASGAHPAFFTEPQLGSLPATPRASPRKVGHAAPFPLSSACTEVDMFLLVPCPCFLHVQSFTACAHFLWWPG